MSTEYQSGSISKLYERARQLRRDMTPAETILWKHLRNRRFGGVKFRRQQPIDYYIADFFCPAARLIIELDGDSLLGGCQLSPLEECCP